MKISALPAAATLDGTESVPGVQSSGTVRMLAQAIANLWKGTMGANIASAAAPDIGAATGSTIHITGTTGITGFVTAAAGVERTTVFDGVLTLTHNATSLILLSGANITTAAGDIARWVSEGSGNWRMISFMRKSGAPLVGLGVTSVNGLTGAVSTLEVLQNSQSAAYTLVITDSGKHIYHPVADTTARTWTIPANSSVAFPIGTMVTFDNDIGAGAITIAINTDTLVLVGAVGSTGSRTLASGGQATAIKVTSTRWRISGTGLT